MSPDIYEKVKDIAIELVNSSERNDMRAHWKHYQELEKVCIDNENGEHNHPFQWESLGDFTNDPRLAVKIYEKALRLAQSKELNEYSASIYLAMAERYMELGNAQKAYKKAMMANEIANGITDLDLKQEISEFLLSGTKID